MNLTRLLVISIVVPSLFVVGIILVSYIPHQAGLFNHEQEHIALGLVMIAGIVPFSIFMIRIFRRIESHILEQNEVLSRRNRETQALLKVSHVVEESWDLDHVLPAVLEAVTEATSAEQAEVWLLDRGGGSLTMQYQHGPFRAAFQEITHLSVGEGYPGIVVETAEPLLVRDLPSDPRFLRQRVKYAGFRTFYALPLRRTRGVLGVLAVAARDEDALSSQDEFSLLQLLGEQIAVAVENARLREEVETLAILTERERIAREMHDGLAQVLGYVNTKVQAVKELLKSGEVQAAVQNMEQLEAAAQETYDDVREGILALGTDGQKQPFLDNLREYVHRFSEVAGVPVGLTVDGEAYIFNPAAEVQLLRIVQESLANIRKHAGANHVVISLTFSDDGCSLIVEDDGKGFDPAHLVRGPWPHLGLQSMRERAAAVGGEFTLDTAPGQGTRIRVDLPKVHV